MCVHGKKIKIYGELYYFSQKKNLETTACVSDGDSFSFIKVFWNGRLLTREKMLVYAIYYYTYIFRSEFCSTNKIPFDLQKRIRISLFLNSDFPVTNTKVCIVISTYHNKISFILFLH